MKREICSANDLGKNIPLESIKIIIDYLYVDEKRHYEECEKVDRKGHIFNHIKTVKRWLKSQ
jgi:hypothetical protein